MVPMRVGRVWAETKRELVRTTTLWALAAALVGAALSLMFGNGGGSANGGFLFTFAAVPVLLVPVAARMASRDRERGFAAVLGTTPQTLGERLTGQALALVTLLAAYVLLALPGVVWVAVNVSDAPLARMLPFLGTGVLVALASIAVGLALGIVAGRRSVAGLSLGFAVAFTWLLLAILYGPVHGVISSPAVQAAWTVLAHASPVTWAFTAHGFHYGIDIVSATAPAGVAVALFGLVALVLAGLVATRLQFAEGYRSPLGKRRGSVVAATLVVLAGVGTLVAWDVGAAPEDAFERLSAFSEPEPVASDGDGLSVGVAIGPVEDPPTFTTAFRDGAPVGARGPAMVSLTVVGEPGRTVAVSGLEIVSPAVRYEIVRPFPETLTMEGPMVNATALVQLQPVDVRGLGEHRHALVVAVVIDDTRFVVEPPFPQLAPAGLTHPGTLAAALTPPLVPAFLALALPRRWNRW